MSKMLCSLARFLWRALRDVPGSIGSNNLGLWFPLIPAGILLAVKVHRSGWVKVKDDLYLGMQITAVSYIALFIYCAIRNVYREHVSLMKSYKQAKDQLEYLNSRPAWQGYQSEQQWKDSIDYQNRLIDIGRNLDGFFSPIQLEALRLAKEIRNFLNSFESMPDPIDVRSQDEKKRLMQIDLRSSWRQRIKSAYALQFEGRVKQTKFKLEAAGFPAPLSSFRPKTHEPADEFEWEANVLTVWAHRMDGARLTVEI